MKVENGLITKPRKAAHPSISKLDAPSMQAKTTLLIAGVLLLSAILAMAIIRPWLGEHTASTTCVTDYKRIDAAEPEFKQCVETNSKLFLERDYAESKDLAKTFLTLLAAALVASITFSEKVVDIHNSKRTPLAAMITCWVLLLLAIVFTGSGLATMALAAGEAAYAPLLNYRRLESHAVILFVAGCLSFGLALACLIVAGIVSLIDKRIAALAPIQPAPPSLTDKRRQDDVPEASADSSELLMPSDAKDQGAA